MKSSNFTFQNMETVHFLCGNYLQMNFIYAIKNNLISDWHYFEEEDSSLSVHVSLPPNLAEKISPLVNKTKPIALVLNAEQFANYVHDDKFVFKGKELKTGRLWKTDLISSLFTKTISNVLE